VKTIEIENLGPIERLSIPVPAAGGVVVLRGRNGSGKTKTLEAVSALTGRKESLSVRDGELRGEASGFGVKITVGRAMRRSGELEAVSLEGRLSVAELVDPEIASPDAADAKRIKALVRLNDAKADPKLFHALAGGREAFAKLIQPADIEGDDLVAMAGRIKRRIEEAARAAEAQAEYFAGQAKAAAEAAAGVDLSAESDGDKLQVALEVAAGNASALRSAVKHASEIEATARISRANLAQALACYRGLSIIEAVKATADLAVLVDASQGTLRAAEDAVRKAEAAYDRLVAEHAAAAKAEFAARDHESAMHGWRKSIEAAEGVSIPSEEAVAAAAESVLSARQAIERGALVRKARAHLVTSEQHAADAAYRAEKAESLREAARATDDVLSSTVAKPGCPLRVEAGRLVTKTKRGKTYYADLSDGERWRIALDIAIDAVGPGGVLPIPQSAWEQIDPLNRREIAEHVRGKGVVFLTAESSSDEAIVADVFDQ